MAIEIEKGVPLPKAATNKPKYPWREMGVGHSFFVTGDDRTRAVHALHAINRSDKSKRFISRSVDGGVRIWRVT